ncbi:four helix bundle protein [uncultured Kordia sp.]|uniref:four helix bundle protein n=1 Tax=uncultured Kordia sp. TaxID=507699 RepID=UPI0026345482|nr:four helix bundle protein [uncultured Kordia sp.]
MKQFSFEKLNVWQKSKDLSVNLYKITEKFPDTERFGLISQIRRCSISVASNIAEGTGRNSPKDKARFTEIAYASLMELLNQFIITYDLNLITKDQYESTRKDIEEISRMLNALRKSQLNQ